MNDLPRHGCLRASLVRGVILFTLSLATGCPATLSDPDAYYAARLGNDGSTPTDTAGSCDAPALIMARCGLPGCHAPGTTASPSSGGLDLVSADVATRLVGVTASTCPGHTLISTDGMMGFLFDKVTSSHPACGTQMPLGGMLSSTEVACLHSWALTLTGGSSMDGGATDGSSDAGMDAR